jgi:hypothetical protein
MHALRRWPAPSMLFVLAACSAAAGGYADADDATAISTEVKVTIRGDQVAAARELLGLADADAKRFEVSFYDTSALELLEAGLILRSRKVHDGGDDVTIKVRPLPRSAVAAHWFQLEGFKAEADRSGPRSVESCSFTVPRSARAIDEVTRGERTIESLFSESQREFARTYSPVAPDWGRLRVIGPMEAQTWKFRLPELETRISAELWTLPDGRQLLELSSRVQQPEADAAAAALDAALRARGLDASDVQETKTKTVLETLVR